MIIVEGGTEINLKSALDMSTKLWVWIEDFFFNSRPDHTLTYLDIFGHI